MILFITKSRWMQRSYNFNEYVTENALKFYKKNNYSISINLSESQRKRIKGLHRF